jgi:lipoate-protein ligase A
MSLSSSSTPCQVSGSLPSQITFDRIVEIPSGVYSGAFNMALDTWILETFIQNLSHRAERILVVRSYGWAQSTLSLGTHQKLESIAIEPKIGLYSNVLPRHWVRRPTGGRAICHGNDLSFSFCTNHPDILKLSVQNSYCVFITWIRKALEQIGYPVQASPKTPEKADYTRSALCFKTAMPFDLCNRLGEKVVGSAQVRKHGALLQHGSIFLNPDAYEPSSIPSDNSETCRGVPGLSHTHQQLVRFNQALIKVLVTSTDSKQPFSHPPFASFSNNQKKALKSTVTAYSKESAGRLQRTETTAGSHLIPVSS